MIITLIDGRRSACGSSLLSNTRAVTAAHCWRTLLARGRQFEVVLGSTLLFSGGTRVITSDVELHASYNMITLANDIAIIKLPWVNYNSKFSRIYLISYVVGLLKPILIVFPISYLIYMRSYNSHYEAT